MRTATAGQQSRLEQLDRQDVFRVQIADHLDVLQDYTVVGGASVDWYIDHQRQVSVNQRSVRLTLRLRREVSGSSIAPRVNANDPIKEKRRVVVSAAVLNQGETVAAGGGWVEYFRGEVMRLQWGGDDPIMVVECWDEAGKLHALWMEAKETALGGGLPEAAIQAILDDAPATTGMTLYTPTSPGGTVPSYTQRRTRKADAIQRVLDSIGWSADMVWDEGTSAFRYTFYEPPRSKTTPDHTFDLDGYFTVSAVETSIENVRNVGYGEWQEGSEEVATDAASIAEYDRIPLFFDNTQDPFITTAAKQQAQLDAAISDTAQPLVALTAECPFDWRFEVHDLIRMTADSIHYSADLDAAVVEIVDTIHPAGSEEPNTTVLYCRGKPTGGVLRWHRKESKRKRAADTADIVDLETKIPPTVEVKLGQSGTTGTLTLVLNDPDSVTTATSFEVQTGGGDFDLTTDPTTWAGYDAVAPYTLTQGVTLGEGHNSFVAWAVRYDLGGGAAWLRDVETFDLDVVPEVQIQGVSRDVADSTVLIHLKGDDDTADQRVTWSIGVSPSEPADPIITDTALGARSGTLDTGVAGVAGQTVWVKARGEDAGGSLAPVASIAEGQFEIAGVPDGSVDEDSFAASLKIAVDKIVNQAAGFSTDVRIRNHATDEDAVIWNAGTVRLADGTETEVNASTSHLFNGLDTTVGTWFLYFDGTATLQETQTYTTAISGGLSNVLLATCTRASTAAAWSITLSVGTYGITGPPIQTEHLAAALITADKLEANSVTATKINVTALSAISADMGMITAGTIDANVIVAATSFTASEVVVDGLLRVKSGTGSTTFKTTTAHPVWGDALLLENGATLVLENSVGLDSQTVNGRLDIVANSLYDLKVRMALATEALVVDDAGSTGATEQDWIEVTVGATTGYIRVYATK